MCASYRVIARLHSSVYDPGMIAPFGSWKSPVTTDLIVADSVNLKEVQLDGDDVYWLEQRPSDAGRTVLVRNGRDVTPAPVRVRSRVHEYGGRSYLVAGGGVYF